MMITEKSAGAIIWRKQKSQLEYLMIQSQPYKQFPSGWGFTKGHLEGTESNEDAAQREVYEEVGLNPKFDFTFHQVDTYHLTKNRQKEVTFFLAEFIEGQQIKLQESEIRQSAWLSYHEPLKCLAAQNYKEFSYKELQLILKKANSYLLNKTK